MAEHLNRLLLRDMPRKNAFGPFLQTNKIRKYCSKCSIIILHRVLCQCVVLSNVVFDSAPDKARCTYLQSEDLQFERENQISLEPLWFGADVSLGHAL